MLEAVRVRKEGFSYRPFFSDFCDAYTCLAYDFTDKVRVRHMGRGMRGCGTRGGGTRVWHDEMWYEGV